MKYKIICFIGIFFLAFQFSAFAQSPDSLLYKRFPNIPPFQIIRVPDSSIFTKKDLQKKKPVLIYIFSPDCDHCIAATKDMIQHYPSLSKKVQILMATPLEYKWIVPFYEEFNFASMPAVTIGRDPSNFLGTFFHVKSYPALFLYNKKGKFTRAYTAHNSFADILKDL